MSTIRDIWRNRKKITEGFKNIVFKDEEVEQIASERLSVCQQCPHIDKSGDKCDVPGTKPCCGICGCSLALKTRSLTSRCADENNPRWIEILDDIEQQ